MLHRSRRPRVLGRVAAVVVGALLVSTMVGVVAATSNVTGGTWSQVVAGGTTSYTVTVENTGASTRPFSITATNLPSGTSVQSSTCVRIVPGLSNASDLTVVLTTAPTTLAGPYTIKLTVGEYDDNGINCKDTPGHPVTLDTPWNTILVVVGNQSISFTSTAPSTATVGGATYTPTATATSGLAVALTIDASASSVCSISGGVVSFSGVGTCTINANQAGDASYTAAPQVQLSFAVGKRSQTISFGAIADKPYGDAPFSVSATASSGLTVTFSSATTGVCTVAATTVTIVAAGTCTIAADQAGNATYSAAPQVQQSFAVGKRSQTISFTSTAPSTATVGGATYTPTATATSGLVVALTIDATASSVCSISGGVVSFIGAGTCVVDAKQAGNGTWAPASQVQQSFAITAAASSTVVTFEAGPYVYRGTTFGATAVVTGAGGFSQSVTVSYSGDCIN